MGVTGRGWSRWRAERRVDIWSVCCIVMSSVVVVVAAAAEASMAAAAAEAALAAVAVPWVVSGSGLL